MSFEPINTGIFSALSCLKISFVHVLSTEIQTVDKFYRLMADSKTSTAVCCITSVLKVYTCKVVLISLCPRRSMMVFGLTPCSASMVP